MEIKVGQRWREVDPRFDRIVEVIEIAHTTIRPIHIRTVMKDRKACAGKSYWASSKRFNGKRGGYELVS